MSSRIVSQQLTLRVQAIKYLSMVGKTLVAWFFYLLAMLAIYLYVRFLNGIRPFPYWGWVVALLPAAMVALQGLFLILVKRHAILGNFGDDSAPTDRNDLQGSGKSKGIRSLLETTLEPAYKDAASQNKTFFDPALLGLMYSLMTLLLAIVSLTLFYVCCEEPVCLSNVSTMQETKSTPAGNAALARSNSDRQPAQGQDGKALAEPAAQPKPTKDQPQPNLPGPVKEKPAYELKEIVSGRTPAFAALRLGAVGAYVYVLIYLGRRNFQRDITSGAALWSAVQLVLGPTLACTIAYFVTPNAAQAEVVGFAGIYFLAGLSPRFIADWINDAVQRSFMASRTTAAPRRLTPLAQIRGITASIESRLEEEGIEDAAALAMVNPVKLLRNTPFDARQIIGWIDEAILIATLPEHWSALQKAGVTGAIDLAWFALDDDDESGKKIVPDRGKALDDLATQIGIKPASALRIVALRLLYDDQVQMLWAIYASNDDGAAT